MRLPWGLVVPWIEQGRYTVIARVTGDLGVEVAMVLSFVLDILLRHLEIKMRGVRLSESVMDERGTYFKQHRMIVRSTAFRGIFSLITGWFGLQNRILRKWEWRLSATQVTEGHRLRSRYYCLDGRCTPGPCRR